jgi:hypothetical protein
MSGAISTFFLTTPPSTDKMTSISGQLLSLSFLLFIFLSTFYSHWWFPCIFHFTDGEIIKETIWVLITIVSLVPEWQSIQAGGLGRGCWSFANSVWHTCTMWPMAPQGETELRWPDWRLHWAVLIHAALRSPHQSNVPHSKLDRFFLKHGNIALEHCMSGTMDVKEWIDRTSKQTT